MLNLEDNGLSSWQEVVRLAHLPALAKLHLSNNPIPDITYPGTRKQLPQLPTPAAQGGSTTEASSAPAAAPADADGASAEGPVAFGKLQAIFLGGCLIESWSTVDELHHYPSLKELRLTGNPVLKLSKSGGRFEVGWGCVAD